MGTRADFYLGRGPNAEWLGSIAWDGHPDGIDIDVLRSTSEAVYRANVARFLAGRDDSTLPEQGWPWPWNDSGTTDYAYALDDGAVRATYGRFWFKVDPEAEYFGECDADERPLSDGAPVEWPDMSERKNVRWDKGSGVIVMGRLS